MLTPDNPIGVFDSGVGGISVLKELLTYLPDEEFLYYADLANAPYGTKSLEEVRQHSLRISKFFIEEKKAKALVIACNTATSAAVNILRKNFTLPIIGMEPALKPAIDLSQQGEILVMATNMTLREKKFQELMGQYQQERRIKTLPCPGLVELIEEGHTEGEKINSFLTELFSGLDLSRVKAVVLGCTHYIFVRSAIATYFPADVHIVDGNLGTAKQVKRLLKKTGLKREGNTQLTKSRVTWFTSGKKDELERFKGFLFK